MTYSDNFKDPRWQKKRLEIMQRDGFKCADCGDGSTMLNVHHRYYIPKRMPWHYPDWALMTLCENCHEDRHECDRAEFAQFEELLQDLTGGSPQLLADLAARLELLRGDLEGNPGAIVKLVIDGYHKSLLRRLQSELSQA